MRKVKASDELRPEYRREDLGVGVRGKYFESYRKGTNLVLLSPDVAKVFTTEEAVNEALRTLISLGRRNRQAKKSVKRITDKVNPDILVSRPPASLARVRRAAAQPGPQPKNKTLSHTRSLRSLESTEVTEEKPTERVFCALM